VQLVAAADKLHNLRSLAADYAEIGEPVWQRFKRGRTQIAWYYRAVIGSLKTGGLDGHPLLLELESSAAQFFGAPEGTGVSRPEMAQIDKI
jgi:hypothetical protein